MKIINIPLNTLKLHIGREEVRNANREFNEETMSLNDMINKSNNIINTIRGIEDINQAVEYIMYTKEISRKDANELCNSIIFELRDN